MRPLHELINHAEPGWRLIQQWAAEATNPFEILPAPDDATRERALLDTQVTTRSPMGAVVYESGGIMVDHGWLRILGSGHPRLPRSLPDWNINCSVLRADQPPPFLLIADDILGGFFAVDGGGLGFEPGNIGYFAPDTLAWENMDIGYSDFLVWAFSGDLARYYQSFRWDGWEDEARTVRGDQALGIHPFLSCEGPSIAERSRKPVSIQEIFALHVGQ